MAHKAHKEDRVFAQKICKEIQSGNQKAINEVRERYQSDLNAFAKRRLSDPSLLKALLTEFWSELSDGKAICQYGEYKGDQSLRACLMNLMGRKASEKKRKTDEAEADKICDQLRAGNQEGMTSLIEKYTPNLMRRAKRKLYHCNADPHQIEEVVNNAWIAISSRGKDGDPRICKFTGNSTLKTFIKGFLENKIKDEYKKVIMDGEGGTEIEEFPDDDDSSKKKELREIIDKVSLQLEESSPNDAKRIRMRLEGLTFEDMAEDELGPDATQEEIDRRHGAIRKQFKRPRTGSMARFRVQLERFMEKEGLGYEDLSS